MYISDILEQKGTAVTTIVQTESIADAAKILREKKFGSLVVRDRQGRLAGIITERDIIRGIAEKGATALTYVVEDLMSSDLKTCKPTDLVRDVMDMMAKRRIRHVPVVDAEGNLKGIISSTDIVKFRLTERASEVNVLKDITRYKV